MIVRCGSSPAYVEKAFGPMWDVERERSAAYSFGVFTLLTGWRNCDFAILIVCLSRTGKMPSPRPCFYCRISRMQICMNMSHACNIAGLEIDDCVAAVGIRPAINAFCCKKLLKLVLRIAMATVDLCPVYKSVDVGACRLYMEQRRVSICPVSLAAHAAHAEFSGWMM